MAYYMDIFTSLHFFCEYYGLKANKYCDDAIKSRYIFWADF